MRNILTGILLAYTVLVTAFTYFILSGHLAASSQACVERAAVSNDYYAARR